MTCGVEASLSPGGGSWPAGRLEVQDRGVLARELLLTREEVLGRRRQVDMLVEVLEAAK